MSNETKEIIFGMEAREKLYEGAGKAVRTASSSLGPRGRTVAVERANRYPMLTGSTAAVLKELSLKEPWEKMGSTMLAETASGVEKETGGGGGLTVILAGAMLEEGMKNIAAGANPIMLRKGMKKAVNEAGSRLKQMARKITEPEQIARVAAVAAGESELGQLVAEAYAAVSFRGVVSVEDSHSVTTELESVRGIPFEGGLLSPYMCTEKKEMAAEFSDAYILLTDAEILSADQLLPVLGQVRKRNRPLVIFAGKLEGEALPMLLMNIRKKTLRAAAVRVPEYGERRRERLKDLAAVTGGVVISEDAGLSLKNVTLEMLGQAQRVRMDRDRTFLMGGAGTAAEIERRVRQLKNQYEASASSYDRQKYLERMACMSDGISVIRVGGTTGLERKEYKRRVETAVAAVKTALESGTVPGGGCGLLHASRNAKAFCDGLEGDEKTGARLLFKSLEVPLARLARNAGLNEREIVSHVSSLPDEFGFDLLREVYVNLFDAGILDPLAAVEQALSHAVSIASSMMTAEALVYSVTK